MPVYLIRHTAPDVAKGMCYGQMDLKLAPTYQSECQIVMGQISLPITRIFHSPLFRAATLAGDISKAMKVPSQEDTRLKELYFGDWEGSLWNDIPKEELDPWGEDFVNRPPPGGESFQEMADRLGKFWSENIVGLEAENTAVVCHGGPIRTMLSLALKTPLEGAFEYKLGYGAVCLLTHKNGEWTLK